MPVSHPLEASLIVRLAVELIPNYGGSLSFTPVGLCGQRISLLIPRTNDDITSSFW